ncbi:hypothetical protein NA57DRAFT_58202 [Rhizodiscina lignyota]|uniref:SMP-30/Gluconolactonase/LRE-like region domain-containing protein n=1 Tax=Rhizodiscina lignyota TaxID=1504668 RepID=A0A9P4M4E6_9PEZI|nr:hypothetical protein NA57DRAFT_58202 [Rhizodiscina lignyota]
MIQAYIFLYILVTLIALCAACAPSLQYYIRAAGTRPPIDSSTTASVVYQFSLGANIENIAVQSDGNLLVTRLDEPELYQINPVSQSASLVHRFPAATGLSGITEIARDEFVVIAGHFSGSSAAPADFRIWKVDVRKGVHNLKVSRIAGIPEGHFLNGVASLGPKENAVLIADSAFGCVYRLDLKTGKYARALEDKTMKPVPGLPTIGINGIKVKDGYVYYTNSFQEIFCRVRIDTSKGTAIGEYEIVATNIHGDDFALGNDGNAYVAGNAKNVLSKVTLSGHIEVIAGDLGSTTVAGATSVAVGRTRRDRRTLYVVTSGAIYAPVNGTYVEGGKVVAVDLGVGTTSFM